MPRITEQEFASALSVWMARAPRKLFRELEKGFQKHADHKGPDPVPAFRSALADHCAGKLVQAGWIVTHESRGNIFADGAVEPVARALAAYTASLKEQGSHADPCESMRAALAAVG